MNYVGALELTSAHAELINLYFYIQGKHKRSYAVIYVIMFP